MRTQLRRLITLGVAGVIAAAAMLFAVVTPASAYASETKQNLPPYWGHQRYGSIAMSPDGSVGKGLRQKTRSQAEQQALQSCGAGCRVAVTFTLCGAVAHDGDRYHGGAGLDSHQAGHDAMSRLGGGWVVHTACN